MLGANQQEKVKLWVMPQLNNLELLHATYITQSFSKHIHEGYAVGVIERGALTFTYRGEKVIAPSGHINLVIPGEAHDGHAVSNIGWSYRMFYLKPKLLEQAAFEISGNEKAMPFFTAGSIKDDYLAGVIRNLHMLLEAGGMTILEQESRLLAMLTVLILRHAGERLPIRGLGQENQAVKLARDYIEDNYFKNITIQDLSIICNLSPFHLIRVFGDSIGVPPHVYLNQVRIKRAKKLLARGFSSAFIAYETGFTDQSHFSKQFKKITGITPSKYSNFIQEPSHPNI